MERNRLKANYAILMCNIIIHIHGKQTASPKAHPRGRAHLNENQLEETQPRIPEGYEGLSELYEESKIGIEEK